MEKELAKWLWRRYIISHIHKKRERVKRVTSRVRTDVFDDLVD